MNCQIPYGMSHRTCKQVLLVMAPKPLERSKLFDIFCCSPPSSASGGGRLSQGGKEKFVTSLVLSRARGLGGKRKSSESAESLASRIYRTLDGVPQSGKWRGGTSKCLGHALNLLNTCTHQKTAACNFEVLQRLLVIKLAVGEQNPCTTIITR
jgi:hypothetical protein